MMRTLLAVLTAVLIGLVATSASAQLKKPNILVIMGDDIGWFMHRAFLIVPAQALVAQWLESFKEFPMRQKPASLNLDEAMQKLTPKN